MRIIKRHQSSKIIKKLHITLLEDSRTCTYLAIKNYKIYKIMNLKTSSQNMFTKHSDQIPIRLYNLNILNKLLFDRITRIDIPDVTIFLSERDRFIVRE